MAKSIKLALNKYLGELTKAELEAEIKKLYSKFADVKTFYELELGDDTSDILESYKGRIHKEYFPTRGYGRARSSESRKVITEFKKVSVFQKDVIDLMLYRVEVMIQFSDKYGDMEEAFYNSIESSFQDACKLIKEERLEAAYKPVCKQLITAADSVGWGLSDVMDDIYSEFLE